MKQKTPKHLHFSDSLQSSLFVCDFFFFILKEVTHHIYLIPDQYFSSLSVAKRSDNIQ